MATQPALAGNGRWREAASLEGPTAPVDGDAQYVLLLDPATMDVVAVLEWGLSNDQSWQNHQFELSADYANRSLLLHFGVFNDGVNGRTALYVDDVSLTVLTQSAAPNRVYLPIVTD